MFRLTFQASGEVLRSPNLQQAMLEAQPDLADIIIEDYEAVQQDFLRLAGEEIRRRWIAKASSRLHSTLDAYVRGISQPVIRGNTVTVTIDNYDGASPDGNKFDPGKLPLMIEDGTGPFRLNDTITSSKTVGFTHSDPRGRALAGATALGDPYRGHWKFNSKQKLGGLQNKLIENVRKLRAGERMKPGVAPKLRARARPGPRVGGRHPGQTRLAAHKTDIYAGLTKTPTGEKRGPRNRLEGTTYRQMGPVSVTPDKWIHPGIVGYRLGEEVEREMDEVVATVLRIQGP